MLRIGHIELIQFPRWLANMVLVPKSRNKWRMCIHFRDLNKACTKVTILCRESISWWTQLLDAPLSMMDASQGYHKILLHPEDRPDLSFITS